MSFNPAYVHVLDAPRIFVLKEVTEVYWTA